MSAFARLLLGLSIVLPWSLAGDVANVFAADSKKLESKKPESKNPESTKAVSKKPVSAERAGLEFFEKRIRPTLVAHCYECHSEKSKIVQGGLYLDTRDGIRRGGDSGPAVVPGDAAGGTLLNALRHEDFEMPPKGKLADETVADFAKWIETGAPDPRDGKAPTPKVVDLEQGRKFWSYQPPKLVPPGALKNRAWPRAEIDRYLLAAMEAQGIGPVEDAPAELLLRRVTFDLIGLPPTPEEIAEFVNDRSPDAYAKLVDRLLARPQFGERWGRHWLDVVRYAESSGKERNVPYRMAWRYRDYVIDAFNADMPYDQFIREQLAGDLLPHASTAERDRHLIATGFLTVGPIALTERVPEQFLLDVADEQLDTTCRAFLASTVGCARCHDHKFDPIPTTDYYALLGIFRSSENVAGVRALRREFSYAHAVPLGDAAIRETASRDLQKRIGDLELELDRVRNDGRAANRKKDPKLIEETKRREAEVLGRLVAARAEAEDAKSPTQFAMAMRDRAEPADYAVRIRGEVDQLGPVVPRGFMSVISDARTPRIAKDRSGRLELAEWIASRDNPLTARVYVNRLWQHLYGRPLVESVDNFGTTGDAPSHPELLDYLALKFTERGWNTKQAIREMVLSRAYQLSGARDDKAYGLDPGNRFVWRFARRRLEAEAIRDAVLAAAGRLELDRPVGSSTLTINNLELGSSARILAADDSVRRRSVYLPMLRNNVPEMLTLFDMADPSLVTGRRETTTVATQALFLMNSPFIAEQSRRMAERLLAHDAESDSAEDDTDARIELAYRLTLTRAPSEPEVRSIRAYLAEAGVQTGDRKPTPAQVWAGVCQMLFSSAEFLYVR